jgi:hypothetical protein
MRRRFIAPLRGGIPVGDDVVTEWIDLSAGRWNVLGDVEVERVYVTTDTARKLGLTGDGPVALDVKVRAEKEPTGERWRFILLSFRTFPDLAGSINGTLVTRDDDVSDDQIRDAIRRSP